MKLSASTEVLRRHLGVIQNMVVLVKRGNRLELLTGDTLHDIGAIGLVVFLTFLAKLLWEAVKTLRRTENQDHLRNVSALLGGLIVLLIGFQATDATTLAIPWVRLGLLVAATRILLEEKRAVAAGATR